MTDIKRNWKQRKDSLLANIPGVELDGTGTIVGPSEENAVRLSAAETAESALLICFALIEAMDELVDEIARVDNKP